MIDTLPPDATNPMAEEADAPEPASHLGADGLVIDAALLPDGAAAVPAEIGVAEAPAAPIVPTAPHPPGIGMADPDTAPILAPAPLPDDAPAATPPQGAPRGDAAAPASGTAPVAGAMPGDAASAPSQNDPSQQSPLAAVPGDATKPEPPATAAASPQDPTTAPPPGTRAAAPPPTAGAETARSDAQAAETIARNPAAASVTVQAGTQGSAPRATRPAAPTLTGAVSAAGVVTLNAMPEATPTTVPGTSPGPADDAPAAPQASIALAGEPESLAPIEETVEEAADAAATSKLEAKAETRAEARHAPTQASNQAATQPSTQAQASSPVTTQGLTATAPGLSTPNSPFAQALAQGQVQRGPLTPPAQQIMPVVVTLAGGMGADGSSVTITLDPVELGRVAISVQRDAEQRATVQVVAERPETLLLLLRDQAGLDRALAQAGVGPEGRSLSFDLAPNDQQQRDGRPENGRSEQGDGGRRGARQSSLAADAAPITSAAPTRQRAAGALDFAV